MGVCVVRHNDGRDTASRNYSIADSKKLTAEELASLINPGNDVDKAQRYLEETLRLYEKYGYGTPPDGLYIVAESMDGEEVGGWARAFQVERKGYVVTSL